MLYGHGRWSQMGAPDQNRRFDLPAVIWSSDSSSLTTRTSWRHTCIPQHEITPPEALPSIKRAADRLGEIHLLWWLFQDGSDEKKTSLHFLIPGFYVSEGPKQFVHSRQIRKFGKRSLSKVKKSDSEAENEKKEMVSWSHVRGVFGHFYWSGGGHRF